MRVILAVLILCLFSACHVEAQLRADTEKDSLLGSVHILRVEKVPFLREGSGYNEGAREVSQVIYDEKGKKTEETQHKGDGSLVNRKVFDYDTEGQLRAVTVYDADGSLYLKKTYSHAVRLGERRVEESIFAKGTTFITKTVYAYDNKGRGVELATFDANGKPDMREVTIYDANGKPTEIEFFGEYNSPTGKAVFNYDVQGNPKSEEVYDKDGLLNERLVYTRGPSERAPVEIAKYDANGKLQNSQVYVREIDDRGNWISETRSERNIQSGKLEPKEITRRTITYY